MLEKKEAEAAPSKSGTSKVGAGGRYYYGNFSIFQSLPDAWGIKQPFPVLPIQRLDEEPSERTVIADVTCDCDGALRKYYSNGPSEETLLLHEVPPGEPYCLAAFLIGSYQESLGDIHNLFGTPAAVSVVVEEDALSIQTITEGQSIAGVLSQVDFSQSHLFDGFTDLVDDALESRRITAQQRSEMIQFFGSMLDSSTYLQPTTETSPAFPVHEPDQGIHRSSLSPL
jgi:arginine decarboxylase